MERKIELYSVLYYDEFKCQSMFQTSSNTNISSITQNGLKMDLQHECADGFFAFKLPIWIKSFSA